MERHQAFPFHFIRRKVRHKKYYTYSAEQVNEMMSAIQSAMDEVKKEFLTDTTEKKKGLHFLLKRKRLNDKFHGLAYVCALLSCEINEKDNDTKERILYRMDIEKDNLAINEKYNLTIKEAVKYFNIGEKNLRRLVSDNPNADYILMVGNKILIKRKIFEQFIDETGSI